MLLSWLFSDSASSRKLSRTLRGGWHSPIPSAPRGIVTWRHRCLCDHPQKGRDWLCPLWCPHWWAPGQVSGIGLFNDKWHFPAFPRPAQQQPLPRGTGETYLSSRGKGRAVPFSATTLAWPASCGLISRAVPRLLSFTHRYFSFLMHGGWRGIGGGGGDKWK